MFTLYDKKKRKNTASVFSTYQEAERFRWTLAYIYNNGLVERWKIVVRESALAGVFKF